MKFIITKVLNLRHAITASLEQLKNEDGKVVLNGNQFQIPKDKVEDFMKEHDELDSVEVAVDLKEKTLHGFSEIKPSVLEALMELFDFEE